MNKLKVLIKDTNAQWYADTLAAACPDYTFVAAVDEPEALKYVPDADIIVGLAPNLSQNLIAAASELKWLQALTTGVDNLLAMPELSTDVILTNCSGFHGPQMSELAILYMLSLPRKFVNMHKNQTVGKWERWPQPILSEKTVCIVGLGAIAEALAKRCVGFEMDVIGVSNGRSDVPGFTKIFKRGQINDAAADCDFMVVVVPHSKETHHIINADVFKSMKPESYFINLSRGGCVDEQALVTALKSGQIAGAGLDVFETEPLPAQSEFWDLPNVTVTPHIGGMSDVYKEQAVGRVVENLNRYAQDGAANLEGLVARNSGVQI